MDWQKLREHKCPKCSGELKGSLLTPEYWCMSCDFQISENKYNYILGMMLKGKQKVEVRDNLAELNNL